MALSCQTSEDIVSSLDSAQNLPVNHQTSKSSGADPPCPRYSVAVHPPLVPFEAPCCPKGSSNWPDQDTLFSTSVRLQCPLSTRLGNERHMRTRLDPLVRSNALSEWGTADSNARLGRGYDMLKEEKARSRWFSIRNTQVG